MFQSDGEENAHVESPPILWFKCAALTPILIQHATPNADARQGRGDRQISTGDEMHSARNAEDSVTHNFDNLGTLQCLPCNQPPSTMEPRPKDERCSATAQLCSEPSIKTTLEVVP